jgi:uncharacterized protein YlxW (UPF0749 family)
MYELCFIVLISFLLLWPFLIQKSEREGLEGKGTTAYMDKNDFNKLNNNLDALDKQITDLSNNVQTLQQQVNANASKQAVNSAVQQVKV